MAQSRLRKETMKEYCVEMCRCGGCQSHFPKAWLADLKKSGAAKFGTIPFCSEKCKNVFLQGLAQLIGGTKTNPVLA